jgi:hypothetical protein
MLRVEDEYDVHQLETLWNEFNNEFGHIKEVLTVLKQFIYLWEENFWDSLFRVHQNWENPLSERMDSGKKHVPESLVLIQAIENGIQPGKNSMEHSVDYESFRNLYIFLEKLHSLYLGRSLVEDDLWALYQSDIVERVLGGLDQFDVFKGNLFLNDEYFQLIKGVTWDDEAELFFKKLHNLLISFLFEKKGRIELTFNLELKNVIVLLAHSSAMWSDSYYINFEHVIRAYKTLFKIITADITFFVDKRYYEGYIVCTTCKESYKLLEYEAPYDFSKCSCGGDLEYFSYTKE